MPEAAKAHTKAGAKAFVVYYWQVIDYAQRTLDVAPLRALSSSGCTGCQGGIKALASIRRAGGHIEGGGESASVRSMSPMNEGAMFAKVRLMLRTTQQVIVPVKPTHSYEPGQSNASVIVSPVEDGWVISELRY